MITIDKCPPVLFWHAEANGDGDLLYHLDFEGEKEIVTPREANNAMTNSKSEGYFVINLN
jgi:hypothetical protein